MANDQRLRRFAILVLVAGAHVLLLMLPMDLKLREYQEPEGSAKRTLLFFPRTPVTELEVQRELRPPAEPQIKTNIIVDVPSAISVEPAVGWSTPGSAITPSINWSEEARRAAAAAAEKVPVPDRSKCDSTGRADPALPNCKPPPEFKWAPPKAGFSNGLPYMRVGDRCVVGLGFFGCALGKPPARGDLFEGMDDPDRERSSVPEPRQ
ncbi:MAG TPA: hypothetical protein VNR40_10270 [Steroidobacter sp.]|nr:hypothetical protein [Steroidobacter sp.]